MSGVDVRVMRLFFICERSNKVNVFTMVCRRCGREERVVERVIGGKRPVVCSRCKLVLEMYGWVKRPMGFKRREVR